MLDPDCLITLEPRPQRAVSRLSQAVRSDTAKSGSGRSERSRATIGAACFGVAREPCQP